MKNGLSPAVNLQLSVGDNDNGIYHYYYNKKQDELWIVSSEDMFKKNNQYKKLK